MNHNKDGHLGQIAGNVVAPRAEFQLSDSFKERLDTPQSGPSERRVNGSIVSWVPSPAYGHHGYIRCEADSGIQGMVLVNSTSLRNPGTMFQSGDNVNFKAVTVSRGYLATDVIPLTEVEVEEGIEPQDADDVAYGVLRHVDRQRYFGILELSDGRTALLHFSELQDPIKATRGATIKCQIEQTLAKGVPRLQARDASIFRMAPAQTGRRESSTPGDTLLEKALLAREEGKYTDAASIYEAAIKASPQNLQVILSYAAMERSLNHPDKAAEIFKQGLERFPDNPKVYEDFGSLLASAQDFTKAIDILENALRISRRQEQAADKGILLNLARTFFKMGETGNPGAFAKACNYYREAEARFERRGLPFAADKRNFDVAKFRSQHHRGEVAVSFFRRAGFDILSAALLQDASSGGDMVVRTGNKDLAENYGLSNQFLVRCMFATEVTMADLLQFEEKIRSWGQENGCGEFVAFVVMASLTPNIQKELNRRILDRREGAPAIVPISQSELETAGDPTKALRAALDKWLFRRDLFAANAPVQGDRFFGRTNALNQIGDAVASSKSVGIFGLRKVGKTSLLHEVRRRSMESGDVVLYLDLLAVPEHVTDTDWLYWELANQLRQNTAHLNANIKWRLGGVFDSILDIPDRFPTSVAFDADLKGILKVISSTALNPHPKVVLMLDEVERLLPIRLGEPGFKGFVAFFSYFRGLSQQTKDFMMIVAAANPSIQEAAQYEGRDNPVFNYFQEVYLRLFDPAECQKMIVALGKGMGIRFEAAACGRIYKLTGGHPFITRVFCSFLAENYAERPLTVTAQNVDSVVERYLNLKGDKDFNEIFERLKRDYPDELKVCLQLAESQKPVEFDPSNKDKVRHLIGYQLVRLDGGHLALSMELMREWLKINYVD